MVGPLCIELREDIRFENGTWIPVDERARELVDEVVRAVARPRRLFSREAVALDRERVSVKHADGLPDLNLFYVAEGDPAVLARLELVAATWPIESARAVDPPDDLTTNAVVVRPSAQPLADAIDLTAADLGPGDVLVIPNPVADRPSWAAAEVAARRGVLVVLVAGAERPRWASHVHVASVAELAEAANKIDVQPKMIGRERRVIVTLETVLLAEGGDLGASELYVEGWIDDADARTLFRVPQTGAITGIRRGDTVEVGAVLHKGIDAVAGDLVLHLEVWEEDLGRDSLVNPDDLIGIHEARFGEAIAWGEGLHEAVEVTGGDGRALVSYRIQLVAGGG